MITERLKIWILLLVVAGCGTGTALAQKMVKVSGTVYNIAENRKVPFSDVTVDVYAAKTVAVGEDMKKILDSNDQEKTLLLDQEGKTTTDENGYYEILVPDNGALIFKVGLSPSVLKEVRHQMKIDVSIDEGVMLESVTAVSYTHLTLPTTSRRQRQMCIRDSRHAAGSETGTESTEDYRKHADSVQYLQTAALLRQPLLATDYTAVRTGLRNERYDNLCTPVRIRRQGICPDAGTQNGL